MSGNTHSLRYCILFDTWYHTLLQNLHHSGGQDVLYRSMYWVIVPTIFTSDMATRMPRIGRLLIAILVFAETNLTSFTVGLLLAGMILPIVF